MNIKVVSTIAGALIVTLALTAGRQYGEAQAQAKRVIECHKQYMQPSGAASLSNAESQTLLQIIELQQRQIRALQASR